MPDSVEYYLSIIDKYQTDGRKYAVCENDPDKIDIMFDQGYTVIVEDANGHSAKDAFGYYLEVGGKLPTKEPYLLKQLYVAYNNEKKK